MADDSLLGTVGKVAMGGVVGFALFFVGTGLGLGRRGFRRQDTLPPRPPPLSRDESPLLYVVLESEDALKLPRPLDLATRARRDARFRRLDVSGPSQLGSAEVYRRMTDLLHREEGAGSPPFSVDDLIARVRAGGRDDVRLISTGEIRAGTMRDVQDALMDAGIKHWRLEVEHLADRKPGEPAGSSRWVLYDKDRVGAPDKAGHYLFQPVRTELVGGDLRISGEGRGHYGGRR